MKFYLGLPLAAIVGLMFTMQICVSSCSKDETIKHDTVTVRDTIALKDTAITLLMMTSTPWKIQEIRGVTGNVAYYYLRGGSSNTQSFDNEYMTFNADNTGIYTDNGGTNTPMTWQFANTKNTSLTYTIPFPDGTVIVTWEHMFYKNGAIRYGEYFINGIKYSHSEGIRIPLNSAAVNVRL